MGSFSRLIYELCPKNSHSLERVLYVKKYSKLCLFNSQKSLYINSLKYERMIGKKFDKQFSSHLVFEANAAFAVLLHIFKLKRRPYFRFYVASRCPCKKPISLLNRPTEGAGRVFNKNLEKSSWHFIQKIVILFYC